MVCNQENCNEPGAYRFTWPGRDEAYICEKHVHGLMEVAYALGLHLQIIPLTEDTQGA